jgi:hypothetical protein
MAQTLRGERLIAAIAAIAAQLGLSDLPTTVGYREA